MSDGAPEVPHFYHPEHLPKWLNVRAELRRLRDDPLTPFLLHLIENNIVRRHILRTAVTLHIDAYEFYYLSLERCLQNMSIARRWFLRVYLRRRPDLTPAQIEVKRRFQQISRYLEYDFWNCLLHARILLDRTVALSRFFLPRTERQPSPTSFNEHKKFFFRADTRRAGYGEHEAYAEYFRTNTDWFELPLTAVRDKFLVHANAAPPHFYYFGYNADGVYNLIVQIPGGLPPEGAGAEQREAVIGIIVGLPQLARQIDQFLRWFNDYALRTIAE